jgi:predicted N-acetyltransferase YhbS
LKLFRGAVAHVLFSRMRTSGFSFDVEVLMMARLTVPPVRLAS